jgi:uncharacterized membrane protein YfcA
MALSTPVRAGQMPSGFAAVAGMIGLGLAMGLAAAVFGIGGGVIAVPALIGLFGAGDLVARGTSLLVMLPAALSGTWANARAGLVRAVPAVAVGAAAVLAGWAAAWAAPLIPPRAGNLVFAALLALSAIRLAFTRRT